MALDRNSTSHSPQPVMTGAGLDVYFAIRNRTDTAHTRSYSSPEVNIGHIECILLDVPD